MLVVFGMVTPPSFFNRKRPLFFKIKNKERNSHKFCFSEPYCDIIVKIAYKKRNLAYTDAAHTKILGIVQVDKAVLKHLSNDEKTEIAKVCEEKMEKYYARLD